MVSASGAFLALACIFNYLWSKFMHLRVQSVPLAQIGVVGPVVGQWLAGWSVAPSRKFNLAQDLFKQSFASKMLCSHYPATQLFVVWKVFNQPGLGQMSWTLGTSKTFCGSACFNGLPEAICRKKLVARRKWRLARWIFTPRANWTVWCQDLTERWTAQDRRRLDAASDEIRENRKEKAYEILIP